MPAARMIMSKPAVNFVISVADQIPALPDQVAPGAGQVACRLSHPSVRRIWGDAAEVDLARLDMDEEQYVVCDQAESRPDFGGKEVGSEQAIRMGLNEVGPTDGVLPSWRGVDAVFLQNVLDGLMADILAERPQRARDTEIAPRWIFLGEPDDMLDESRIHGRPADGFWLPLIRGVKLSGHELAVPAENRIDLLRGNFAELHADGGQGDALDSPSV
jgi:hypothetical protein